MDTSKTASLTESLLARARRRGEPTGPILRRAVLAVIQEVREGLRQDQPRS